MMNKLTLISNKLLLIRLILLTMIFGVMIIPGIARGATVNALSCSQTDVQAAIDSASDGDTVVVPAGNCVWGNFITIANSITIEGAGIDKTNIIVDHSNPLANGKNAGFYIQTGTNDWRISGFTLNTSDSATDSAIVGSLWAGHQNLNFRIDNNKFIGFHYATIITGDNRGVIDNNEFFGGGVQLNGPNSGTWNEETRLGSDDFVFVENNTFTDLGSLEHVQHVLMGGWGERYVFRYNTVIAEYDNATIDGISGAVDSHGYCHGSSSRGTRAYEIYGNTFVTSSYEYPSRALYLRSGTGIVYNNTFDQSSGRNYIYGAIDITEYRAHNAGAIGTDTATCSAGCDVNALCHDTYYKLQYDDVQGPDDFAYDVSITGSSSGANATILWADKGDRYLYFLSINNGPFQDNEELRISGVKEALANGNSIEVDGTGYPCCDQIGRGNAQTLEPLYCWGNMDHNSNAVAPTVNNSLEPGYIVENRDYFLDSYVTDQGDGSYLFSNPVQGDTIYTPYTYPHPLTNTTGPTPLTITTTSLSTGAISSPYSQSLSATGGTSPYTWSLSSGTLPGGLSLSSSGVISGTPTQEGTFNFTVQVQDSDSPASTDTQDLSITVNPDTTPPSTTTTVTDTPTPTPTTTPTTAPTTMPATTSTINLTTTTVKPAPPTTSSTSSTTTISSSTTSTDSTTSIPWICPVIISLEGDDNSVELIRAFSREVLVKSKVGREYIDLYYRHAAEVSILLLSDPDLRAEVAEVLYGMLPEIESIVRGEEVVLPFELTDEIAALLDEIEIEASPGLKRTIKRMRRDLRRGKVYKQLGIKVIE